MTYDQWWYSQNKEKKLKYAKQYKIDNKEYIRIYQDKYNEEHKIEKNKKSVEYYHNNRDSRLEYRCNNKNKYNESAKYIRVKLVILLGGKCIRSDCHLSLDKKHDIRYLGIDHIEGGGRKEIFRVRWNRKNV